MTEKLFESALHVHSRCVVVTNPCNPTGISLSQSSWQNLIHFCCDHHLILVVDRSYAAFETKSYALPNDFEWIELHSFSKSYGIRI